ncbi:MAG: sugar phosphate isomerase/epimerase [Verrucomicrobiae bacterium]|nr:sugar phosphate isomerase/epimerase [Verrucomicrobiae bacterium]
MKRAILLVSIFTLLLPASAPAAAGTGDSFKGPLGLQLYSLRDSFSKDVPGTLKKVHDFGFRTVELAGNYGKTPEEFSALLKANGLKAVAGHFSFETFRDNPEAIAKEAKTLGLEWAGTAWAPHSGQVTEAWAHETAKIFNHAGEVLARHGIKFFYHNHGYEFVPLADGTVFDVLVRETKPGLVYFEMDVMWTVFPGQDPAKLMEKYPDRWGLMHVKDLKKGVSTGSLAGSTDVRNDVVLGTGQTDWVALLRAAQKAGVKHYFIEDESPSVLEQIPQSLKFLENVKF